MRTPHTSCKRGKRVRVVLRDGSVWIDRFVERTGKFVVLQDRKLRGEDISSFQILKGV